MKAMRLVAAVICPAALAAAVFAQTPSSAPSATAQRLIVILKPGTGTPPDIAALGGRVEFSLPDRMIVAVPASAIAAIEQNPRVQYVQRSAGAGEPPDRSSRHDLFPESQQVGGAITSNAGNGEWKTGTYLYDGAGNISAIGAIGTGTEPNSDGRTNTYRYDKVGRLVQGSANYGVGNYNETYLYDPFGNMTRRDTIPPTGPGEVVITAINPATNQRPKAPGEPDRYDAAGNEIYDPSASTRHFDALNMMTHKHTSLTDEYYVYTPDDQRIGVLLHTSATPSAWPWTWSLRDEGGSLLRQYSSSELAPAADWLWIEDYVYAGDRLLGAERMAAQGGRRHFHLDHLGTPRLITGAGGVLIARHDYLPFGREVTPDNAELTAGLDRVEPRQFTGHERDSAQTDPRATLDYMHARYYSGELGRFLSVDSHLGRPEKPNSWNRYVYADNSPVNAFDPTGRWTVYVKRVNITAAVGKGVGVGVGTFDAISSNGDISFGVTTKFGGGEALDAGMSFGISGADSAEEFSEPVTVVEGSMDVVHEISLGGSIGFVEGKGAPDAYQCDVGGGLTGKSYFVGVEKAHVLSNFNVKQGLADAQTFVEKNINKAITGINSFADAVKTAATPGVPGSFDVVGWLKARFAPSDVDAKKAENK